MPGETGWPTPPESAAWYEVVDGDTMRQGDIYSNIVVYRLGDDLRPDSAPDAIPVARSEGTFIILSPSCDLEQERVQTGVLLAQVWPADEERLGATKRSDYRKRLELLRQDGYAPRFLLPAFEGVQPPFPWSFVEWRQPFFLPRQYLQGHRARKRLRLRHPFREKLGAWAGQRLSEIGIETDHGLKRIISIGGAGDILEAREAQDKPPTADEATQTGSV